MKILILDGDNFQALRLLRDLGKEHSVYIGGKTKKKTLSYYSRFCNGFVNYQDDSINEFEKVLKFIQSKRIDLIIPTTERSCVIVNHYRIDIQNFAFCSIATSSMRDLEVAFDKSKTFDFCQKNNIKTPLIEFQNSEKINSKFVVLKAITSNKVLSNGKIVKTDVPEYFKNDKPLLNNDNDKFFQEHIKGSSVGFFAVCNKGEILDSYTHKRILDTNPSGSGSCVRKSILSPNKDLIEISKKIIQNLNWNGPIMLEYLQNKQGDLYLLEINGRLWGSYCLSSYSGINFTNLLLNLYSKVPKKNIIEKSKRKEVIVTNEVLLLYRWIRILKGPDKNSSEKFPKRLKIISELKFLFAKKEIFSAFDPLPILRFLWIK